MKLSILLFLTMTVLTACNFKEDLKSAGDSFQDGVQSVGKEAKKAPGAVSDASNEAEKDIKE